MPEERYGLTELADVAAVTPRTVRYYIAQGLLPAVGQSGPGAKYGAVRETQRRASSHRVAEHSRMLEIEIIEHANEIIGQSLE